MPPRPLPETGAKSRRRTIPRNAFQITAVLLFFTFVLRNPSSSGDPGVLLQAPPQTHEVPATPAVATPPQSSGGVQQLLQQPNRNSTQQEPAVSVRREGARTATLSVEERAAAPPQSGGGGLQPDRSSRPETPQVRRQGTHRLPPDPDEFARILGAPTSNDRELYVQMNQAFEACYNCEVGPFLRSKGLARKQVMEGFWSLVADRVAYYRTYLPAMATPKVSAVLCVGLAGWRSALHIEHHFRAQNPDVLFVTVDPLIGQSGATQADTFPPPAYYGNKSLLVVDVVQNIAKHGPFPAFDVVLMHGVFGWGLNGRVMASEAAAVLHTAMAPRGLLYMWRNHNCPGDGQFPADAKHASREFLTYLEPYFKPDASLGVPSELEIPSHRWSGVANLLRHVG